MVSVSGTLSASTNPAIVTSSTTCSGVTSVLEGSRCSVVDCSKPYEVVNPVPVSDSTGQSPLSSSTPVHDVVSCEKTLLSSCPFLDSPCVGCVPASGSSLSVNDVPFQGFSPPSCSVARSRVKQLKAVRQSQSLAAVRDQIAESQRMISEFRRRSCDRIQNLSRLSFRRTSTPVCTREAVNFGLSGRDFSDLVTPPVSSVISVSDVLVSANSFVAVCKSTPVRSRPFTIVSYRHYFCQTLYPRVIR